MTTTTERPGTIRASIHQDAINRVSEFFSATNRDILNELLQNSRRSGAARVEITTGKRTIKVSDDGMGIGDPASILAFGQTGWDEPDTRNEHPAGMGLYALARREQVSIVSRTRDGGAWRVELTPDHFVGKLEAPVVTLPEEDVPAGTSVAFTTTTTDPKIVITEAARHYPLPVSIDGVDVQQEDFLHAATHIEEWRGVRIGVYEGGFRGRMNFHGVVIEHPQLPQVEGIEQTWHVRADVRDCPELTLTLPARRDVVETPFMEELRRACRLAVYRAISRMDKPADLPFAVQQEAAGMGIELPDAAPRLAKWEPGTARETRYWSNHQRRHPLGDGPIIVGLSMEVQDQQALGRAAERSGLTERLYEPDPRLSGYRWYDRLVSADLMSITITDEYSERDLEEIRQDEKAAVEQRPESILINLTCSDGSGILLPADLAFLEGEEGDCQGNRGTPLVTRDSGIEIHELRQLMMDAYFYPDDDGDCDTVDTQEYELEQVYERTATRVLRSPEDAAEAAIIKAVKQHIIHEIPSNMTAVIRIKRGEAIQVILEEDDSQDM